MSLQSPINPAIKAKIEAIVYATEEPVTVDQLLALLKDDLIAAEEASPSADVGPDQLYSVSQQADGWTAEAPAEDPEGGFVADSADNTSAETGNAPADDQTVAAQGELLDPKKAQKQENKRYKQLIIGALDELIADYARPERGIEVREVAGGYRMSTKPEHHDVVRAFAKSLKPPVRLSLPALETLAVIAYKQPVTAPEISEIRGVDSSGVLANLISRKLITTAGRKQVVGRPILYKTTKEFLMRFGLKDIHELPSMEEFEKLTAQSEMFDDVAGSETGASAASDDDGQLAGISRVEAQPEEA